MKWVRYAAEEGDDEAQFNLGLIYAEGRGVPKNKAEAYKWWLISAAQGQPEAKRNCGILERDLKSTQMLGAQLAARNFKPLRTQPVVTPVLVTPPGLAQPVAIPAPR